MSGRSTTRGPARWRRGQAVLLSLVSAAVLSGCGVLQLEQLPAPSAISGPSYTVTAHFADIGNLTIGANVKLAGVLVGQVDSISTEDYDALVGMRIEKRFRLSTGTRFEVRFTTPLGEDFIAALEPAERGTALTDGAVVPTSRTDQAPTIEDTFAALSLLLNGGGLDKVHVIVSELQAALHGRAGTIRDALVQARAVTASLADHADDIDRALAGLNSLSAELNRGQPVIEQALEQFPATLNVLAADTDQIRTLVTKVATLGTRVRNALQRSSGALLDDLDQLRPTLDALQGAQGDLVPTMNALIDFGKKIDTTIPGNYIRFSATAYVLLDSPVQVPHPESATTTNTSDSLRHLLTGGSS